MKPLKISVFLFVIFLLPSLAITAHAATIHFQELVDFNYIVHNKNKVNFDFLARLPDSSNGLSTFWSVETSLKNKGLDKTPILAGSQLNETENVIEAVEYKSVLIEPVLNYDNMDSPGRITFHGTIDPFNLTGTSDPWSIYMEITLTGETTGFSGYISGIDPELLNDSTAPVPEPATMMLLGAGMLCMTAVRRRIKK